MASTAFAVDRQTLSDTIVFKYNGHGEYQVTNNSTRNANRSVDNVEIGETIVARTTDDSDIYYISADKYLILARGNTYLLSDKIDVDVGNFSANKEVFDGYGISDYLRDDMEKVIKSQREFGNNDLQIDVYVPGVASNGIQPFADEPIGERYYTYIGDYGIVYYLKDVTVKYWNLASGMKEVTGSTTLTKAKAFTSFAIDIGSIFSKAVGAFSTVLGFVGSAYDVYNATYGAVSTGSSGDRMYTNLIYDRVTKATYVREPAGTYNTLSHLSFKAWLNRHDTYQYYGATGKSYLVKPSLNVEIYSPTFKDPAYAAINGPHRDQYLYATVQGIRVLLAGE